MNMKRFLCLILFFLTFSFAGAQDHSLPDFKEVFHPQIEQHKNSDGTIQTIIRIPIPKNYYLYRKSLNFSDLAENTRIDFSDSIEKQDDYFGKVAIYDPNNPLTITLSQDKAQDTYTLSAQGCLENVVCYPLETWQIDVKTGKDLLVAPKEENNFLTRSTVNLLKDEDTSTTSEKVQASSSSTASTQPTAQSSEKIESESITARLESNFLYALFWVFLIGIGVSFTACIYPLIPIVSSLVVGKETSTMRSQSLIFVYVLGMASAMAVLGALFGFFELNLQILLQKPIATLAIALFFVVLSASLFDCFTLQTPRALQNVTTRLESKLPSAGIIKAGVLGALSILVVSPCATPILTALLLYCAQTSPIKGALVLFVFGFGTGLPLFLYASVFRKIMPASGEWMNVIKKAFAFMMLAIATWLATRAASTLIAYTLWMSFALFFALYLFEHTQESSLRLRLFFRFFAGIASLIALSLAFIIAQSLLLPKASTPLPSPQESSLQKVEDIAQLSQKIAQSARPTLLYFSADWCISCTTWENEIWNNPALAKDLSAYQLLKVDVTHFSEEHRALFKKLSIVGPPALFFFKAHGDLNLPQDKLIGTISPEDFAKRLQRFNER